MSRVGKVVRGSTVVVLAIAGGVIGSAVASTSSPPDSTSVGFISITPHRVLSNVLIPSRHSSSPVVIGGLTTVPSDATTVQLSITAHSVTSGSIAIYSAGNPRGSGDHFVQYPKNVTVTANDNEHPGTANEITLTNTGSSAVTVTVTITGYSTQVNAGSINGAGGSAGDALVNNGDGTTGWGASGRSYMASGGGVVVTPYDTAPGGQGTIVTLDLPPGNYALTAVVGGEADVMKSSGVIDCGVFWNSPGNPRAWIAGVIVHARTDDWFGETATTMGQLSTATGGSATVVCEGSPVHDLIDPCDRSFDAFVSGVQLRAEQVGQVTGPAATDSSGYPTSWLCR